MAGAASPATSRQMDPSKLDAFMGKFVMDMGAAMHAALVARPWARRPANHPFATP